MTREMFIDFALINDISFSYAEKEYFILQDNNFCICGEYEHDETTVHFDKYQDVYQNIEDMLNNWKINGIPLSNLIKEIEFLGN